MQHPERLLSGFDPPGDIAELGGFDPSLGSGAPDYFRSTRAFLEHIGSIALNRLTYFERDPDAKRVAQALCTEPLSVQSPWSAIDLLRRLLRLANEPGLHSRRDVEALRAALGHHRLWPAATENRELGTQG
jgi:hypothetical protein